MRQNEIRISGAVTRPGTYDIGDGLRLSDLIIKADSLLGDAYLEMNVIRTKGNFSKKLIKLNLKKALLGDPNHDIFLQNQDMVKVYGITSMMSDRYVSIAGNVKRPEGTH